MFGPELGRWLQDLDARELVLFVRGLLEAEANLVRAELGVVGMTGNIAAADEGVDGRTDIGPDTD